jgi:hypothetical protein
MLQFIPGTDFIHSGYSAMPKLDNLFGGGNFDADDLDDYNVLQRDMRIDAGLRPITEEQALAVRRQAGHALQAVYEELDFPAITDEEVEAAALAHSSDDMPERDTVTDLAAAERFLGGSADMLAVVRALARRGFQPAAANILEMGRQRVIGDYLQPSAIFADGFRVLSAINDPNDYIGPGTGYRVEGVRRAEIETIRQAKSPHDLVADQVAPPKDKRLVEAGDFKRSTSPREVVLAVGPAFGAAMSRTIGGLEHEDVLAAVLSGIASEGLTARIMKVYRSADLAGIAAEAVALSGSGIAIALQSRGTAMIQKAGLARLNNLELFPQSPNLTLETYEAIGRNAARYVKGEAPVPVPVRVDNWVRLRLIAKTALLHRREIDEERDRPPAELLFDWEPDV